MTAGVTSTTGGGVGVTVGGGVGVEVGGGWLVVHAFVPPFAARIRRPCLE